MNFKVNRNHRCPCDSGIKYKKCCYQSISSVDFDLSSFEEDRLNQADYQDGREILCDVLLEELQNFYYQLEEFKNNSNELPADFFTRLHEFNEKHPKHPIPLNYLYNGYILIGDHIKANSYMLEMYQKFPLYFFGRFIYASICLYNKEHEKAFEILGKYDSLKDLYPERKKFHVSEGYTFHEFLVKYHAKMKNRVLAERHYNCLVQLASSYPTHDSTQIIKTAREQIEWITFAAAFQVIQNMFTEKQV